MGGSDAVKFDRCSLIVVLVVSALIVLGGCAPLPGPSSPGSGNDRAQNLVEDPLRTLRENFERRRLRPFSRAVHPDYRRYGTELRSNLSSVYRVYSGIQLEFYGIRANRSNGTIVASVNWNLRWTCQSPSTRSPSGCQSPSDVGNVIIRRGRTDLEFMMDEGQWRLINQNGDLIFGSLAPGSVR